MVHLSANTLHEIEAKPGLQKPGTGLFNLPEKVLQFGTGVLLRGLPDYFIDKANRKGIFNGRIVVVKSTASGGTDAFAQQDGLYAQVIRGIEDGKIINEVVINASISRVLAASGEWNEILNCAHNPEIKLIISNTTEVGITLQEDDLQAAPPVSFPGKLLAFLYERYKVSGGTPDSGFVIVPTELISDNGTKLKDIVLTLAANNQCESAFIQWVKEANFFCNSLVDRIVPGKLTGTDLTETQRSLGFTDDLMIMSEVFRLWAIECTDPRAREMLSFAKADEEGVVLTNDLEKFRELKLRLLNATHTISCAYAWLSGFTTVKQAMEDKEMGNFITQLGLDEIAPAIVSQKISYEDARQFALRVFDRFRNPYLEHQWLSISAQYSSKMKMRVVPLLLSHYENTTEEPLRICIGFAAYLLLLKVYKNNEGQYTGKANGVTYLLQDDDAAMIAQCWQSGNADEVVDKVLANTAYWQANLNALPGFAEALKEILEGMLTNGMPKNIAQITTKQIAEI
jgi:tagaturonate reductase